MTSKLTSLIALLIALRKYSFEIVTTRLVPAAAIRLLCSSVAPVGVFAKSLNFGSLGVTLLCLVTYSALSTSTWKTNDESLVEDEGVMPPAWSVKRWSEMSATVTLRDILATVLYILETLFRKNVCFAMRVLSYKSLELAPLSWPRATSSSRRAGPTVS